MPEWCAVRASSRMIEGLVFDSRSVQFFFFFS
jgi:hypothetical protein